MKYKIVPSSLALLALAVGVSAAPRRQALPPLAPPAAVTQAAKLKAVSSGTYHDAQGGSHAWSISQTHTLAWDGANYIPVGGTFAPLSWAADAGADAWAADQKTLGDWKAHGVLDVVLTAGSVGLTHVPPENVQRLLNYLDAGGFRYGIEIADFPKDPLVGYVIKPGAYRDAAPPATGPARFGPISGLADAFYMLVSKHDGEIDEQGNAQIVGADTAVVHVQNAGPDDVLLLYPQRMFLAGSPESHLPDLWQGYDEYRDRVLLWFHHIALGPGFRFFLDPLTEQIGLDGDVESLVPTTDGFRLDFQAWLDKKYQHNVDDMNRGWGIADRSSGSAVPDFATAARCIPLWSGSRGVPSLYDPTTHTSYGVMNKPRIQGHYWQDLDEFRIESTRGYMNDIASALQRGVADVPVVYQWNSHTPLFSNTREDGGYDGLSLDAATGVEPLTSGAYLYSQAEESPQTSWLITENIGPVASRRALFETWDTLSGIGSRGFFLPTPTSGNLDWINAYSAGAQLDSTQLADARPRLLPYPADLGLDLGVRQLRDGAWWLPSYRSGYTVTLGPTLMGYALPNGDSSSATYVVWSPHGQSKQAHFDFPKTTHPLITDALGTQISCDVKGGVWTIPVSEDPILISNVPSISLSLDAADDAAKEAKRLMAMADDQKIDTERIKEQLFYAINSVASKPEDGSLRYDMIEHVIGALTDVLRPYTWVEAESATKYTFDSLVPDADASGGAYLSLDSGLPPPSDGGYHADYSFQVNAAGRYTLWMAGPPLGTPMVSPFHWSVDGGVNNPIHGASTEGAPYADKFVWSNLGDATLDRGSHTFSLVIDGPRTSDGRYALAIDAFCITRAPFHPDGPHQPVIDTLPPPDAPATDTRKSHK